MALLAADAWYLLSTTLTCQPSFLAASVNDADMVWQASKFSPQEMNQTVLPRTAVGPSVGGFWKTPAKPTSRTLRCAGVRAPVPAAADCPVVVLHAAIRTAQRRTSGPASHGGSRRGRAREGIEGIRISYGSSLSPRAVQVGGVER